jgi:hypothetical protein
VGVVVADEALVGGGHDRRFDHITGWAATEGGSEAFSAEDAHVACQTGWRAMLWWMASWIGRPAP